MSQYKVTACYTVYCYATVEAENKDDAHAIAKQMDGGDFDMEPDYGLSDWRIEMRSRSKDVSDLGSFKV